MLKTWSSSIRLAVEVIDAHELKLEFTQKTSVHVERGGPASQGAEWIAVLAGMFTEGCPSPLAETLNQFSHPSSRRSRLFQTSAEASALDPYSALCDDTASIAA